MSRSLVVVYLYSAKSLISRYVHINLHFSANSNLDTVGNRNLNLMDGEQSNVFNGIWLLFTACSYTKFEKLLNNSESRT